MRERQREIREQTDRNKREKDVFFGEQVLERERERERERECEGQEDRGKHRDKARETERWDKDERKRERQRELNSETVRDDNGKLQQQLCRKLQYKSTFLEQLQNLKGIAEKILVFFHVICKMTGNDFCLK